MDQRNEWLRGRMDALYSTKARLEARGKDINTSIQGGHEYKNPRICEKLIETLGLDQYGSNFDKSHFDARYWRDKPAAFYDSREYARLAERRELSKPRSPSPPKSPASAQFALAANCAKATSAAGAHSDVPHKHRRSRS